MEFVGSQRAEYKAGHEQVQSMVGMAYSSVGSGEDQASNNLSGSLV